MKKIFTILMMAILAVAVVSCDKDPEVDPGTENPPVVVTYSVGDVYNDGVHRGVVFEVLEEGLSYKIVAIRDAEKKLLWSEANEWCKELGEGWRLPSVDEAKILYDALADVNATLVTTTGAAPIQNDWYWTADKAENNEFAWTFSMQTGQPAYYDLYSGYENTRAIRTIGDRESGDEEQQPAEFSIVGQWEVVDILGTRITVEGVEFKEGFDFGYTNTGALTEYLEVAKSEHSSYQVGTRYDLATCHYAESDEEQSSVPYTPIYQNGALTGVMITVEGESQTWGVEIIDENNITLEGIPLRRVESQPLSALDIIMMEPEVKALCVENWDSNKDGWIDIAEAAAVTDLDKVFFQSSITSFLELKYFTGLTTIANSAFMHCTSLRKVIIPENVTKIRRDAFKYCERLDNITIPAGVTLIEPQAFLGCDGMEAMTCLPTTPPSLGADALFTVADNPFKILVPNESYELYISANDWKEYKERIYTMNNRQLITFADSKVKAICVEKWDSDKDGEISYDEAAAVNLLANAFRNSAIKEFTELQHFTGLRSIGEAAFEDCHSLKRVVIPDNVTSIDKLAFNRCKALESITIGKNIKTIGDEVFYDCSSLSNVQIRTGVTSIGDYAFGGCSALTIVQIPDSVISIGKFAFLRCSSLHSVTLPKVLEVVKNGTFMDCTSLKYITIPEAVTTIEQQVFFGCTALTNATLPLSLTSIGKYAFAQCSSLASVTIPEKVTSMGDYLFTKCSSLSEVICEPSYPPTAGQEMFYGNADDLKIYVYDSSLDSYKKADRWSYYSARLYGYSSLNKDPNAIAFADNEVRDICLLNWDTNKNGHLSKSEAAAVKSIGKVFQNSKISTFDEFQYFTGLGTLENLAFWQCSSLSSITLPSNLTAIGAQAFQGCISLASLEIPNTVSSIGEYAFMKCSSLTTVNIPFYVNKLEDGLFDSCYSLRYVDIPIYLMTIGNRVFANCESMHTVIIPACVITIGDSAFANCNSLQKIAFPNSVVSLGAYVCFNCANLETVHIGHSVSSILYAAFFRCPKLSRVFCSPNTPPTAESNIFSENAVGRKIYVPTASVEAYKKAKYWSNYNIAIEGYDY